MKVKGANLLRDGVARVAQHARGVISRARGPHCLCVRPTGKVRLFYRPVMPDHEIPNLVGTYNRRSPIEHIAADCEVWLKEQGQ